MPKGKSATIRLTASQRAQIRKLTGSDHASVKFEVTPGKGAALATKSELVRKLAPTKFKGPITVDWP